MFKNFFMDEALIQAKEAYRLNEVPVGCVIVYKGKVIAKNFNKVIALNQSTAHAEMLALSQANKFLNASTLDQCDLYVNLEPCHMCASAIAINRIRRVFYGAFNPKEGGTDHGAQIFKYTLHKPEVMGGIQEQECSNILKSFFKKLR